MSAKVAIVFDGSRGIGGAIASRLATLRVAEINVASLSAYGLNRLTIHQRYINSHCFDETSDSPSADRNDRGQSRSKDASVWAVATSQRQSKSRG